MSESPATEQPTSSPRKAVDDPKYWTSKGDSLQSKSMWDIKRPGSLSHTLRVAYGIDQPCPLLVSELEDDTFLLKGNLMARNGQGTVVIPGTTPDGFFFFSATAGQVQRIMEPASQEGIWAKLNEKPMDVKAEEIQPLCFEVEQGKSLSGQVDRLALGEVEDSED
ncbi:hypothetical protein BU26DRAFT_525830 [Trematosphaeria pertusa]|uniref:Uncharacterized protein n=1 Tax=Trematosphaeria pertusa TaxID=390896 RepID=A0A6A6HR61_9PLEO|nr:uncharacterized protein BU26DRAFT_525830 [Trematosphaeria pertusa]KAF2240596.1 hypothetical protein BU26DRAFT_525830 [Trematosphaeria pertusa]